MFGLLLVIATLELGVYAETIQLLPKYVNVVENTSVTLTCSKRNGDLAESKWTNSQIQDGKDAGIYYDGKECHTTWFLQNNNLFDGVCNGDGTYSVLLKRVDRTQFGAVWQCREGATLSNQVTIKKLVSVTSVDIYLPTETYMKENHSQTIRCKTSACRPQPTIRWFLRSPINRVDYNITDNTTQISSENEDGLEVLEGLLYLLPNRSLNGWALKCQAWNSNQSPAVISKEVVLNISYPPDSPPKIHGYGPDKPFQIIEADHGEFSCSIAGGNPLANLSWNCFNSESTTVQVVNESVISNVTWTAVRGQNVCSCESYHIYNGKKAAYVNLTVLYNTLQISCKSISNPMPSYTWNGPDIFNRLGQILRITVTHMHEEGRYKCTAKNRMVRSDNTFKDGTNTSYINIKMLYPPTELHCRYGNKGGELISKNSFYVIKGDSFLIYCDAEGYPRPVFKWDNYTDGRSLNITAISADVKKTCVATNWMKETVGESRIGSNSAIISISVLYPPSIPTIRVSNGITNEITDTARISIIETDTIVLSCHSKSKPRPTYTWFLNGSKIAEQRNVTLANISRANAGNYTCLANNIMNRTFGIPEYREKTSSTLFNVLYPPEIGSLTNISLTEESTLNITCPVIHGNPLNTTVFWSRKKDYRRWNNKQLIIRNVSRTDDTVYTCTVLNKMIPTFGSVIEKTRSGEFHLNIFFSPDISNFSVLWREYKEITVVNETEEVPLSCTAESNPASNITITGPKQEVIVMVSSTNIVHHTLRNVSYVNAGQYKCTGRNDFTNDKTSSSKLILIVRCPPRPSSDKNNDGKVATTLHADVTLTFTAHDFLDEPDKTVFMWFKDNTPVESNVSKFFISSLGLQSNLSVNNVTKKDFGQYIVRVTNSIGNYVHTYGLQAKDKPEVPKDFSYINDSITDSSVIVKWVPGFHGGYPQNFILLYKRIMESYWQNKSIGDTGDRHMDYTLVGLLSKSEYQVKMFARNEEGDSPYTSELQFSTKSLIAQPIESVSSDMVGIVAGSVSSAVIVSVAGVIVGVFIYRRRSKQKESQKVYYDPQRNTARVANESSSTYEALNDSKRERDLYSQLPATFEQLDNASRERSAYSEIENTGHDMSDYVNMRI